MLAKDRIKSLRKQRGLTLNDFAEHIGVSQGNASRYENGSVRKIPEPVLIKIAEVFNCSVLDIVKDDPAYPHLQAHPLSVIEDDIDKLLVEWYHTRTPEVQRFIRDHVQADMKNA